MPAFDTPTARLLIAALMSPATIPHKSIRHPVSHPNEAAK
jgi:hypothetical protein